MPVGCISLWRTYVVGAILYHDVVHDVILFTLSNEINYSDDSALVDSRVKHITGTCAHTRLRTDYNNYCRKSVLTRQQVTVPAPASKTNSGTISTLMERLKDGNVRSAVRRPGVCTCFLSEDVLSHCISPHPRPLDHTCAALSSVELHNFFHAVKCV